MSTNTQFSSDHLLSDLKGHSVRGGVVTFIGQCLKFILNLVSTMILARLLLPQDFGLIAMVTAITSFVLVFNDLGLSAATLQRPNINNEQISTLFWINVALGILLMCITSALAPVIAWFYQDSRLTMVTVALSVAFLFGGFTVQHQALLRRQMRLFPLAMIDVSSMAAGILTAILCAWAGLEYWALVWMQIATAVANALGVWLASGWTPVRPVRRSGVRSMAAFGGYLTGFNFVNYFARNLDSVLIGRVCGTGPLGLYSRAYSLLMFPIGQITAPMSAVAVPALSRLQNEPERYRSYYLKAIRIIAYLSFPLVMALAILSTEVITLVLGQQWLDAAPIFRILAVTAMFQPIVSTVGWLYISLGQSKRMAVWGVASSAFIISSFLIGVQWGALGVAASYAVCQIFLIYPCLSVAMAKSPLTPSDVFRVAYRPFFFSLCIGIGMLAAKMFISMSHPVLICLFSVTSGCASGTLVVLLWPAMRQDLVDMTALSSVFLNRNLDKNMAS